jgi:hypothetical protein
VYIAGNTSWRSPERPARSGPETGRELRATMYSGRKQRLADWAGIDAGARWQHVPDVSWLSEKVAVNRGNGASPGRPNRSVSPPARIPARPGGVPKPGNACWSGGSRVDRGLSGRGRDATPRPTPGKEYHSITG